MAFESYLNYDEYLELGGKVSEEAFPNLERKAQRWIDYFTFNRIPLLPSVPDEVKEVIVEYIDKISEYEKQSSDGDMIAQYSNGVENITYRRTTEDEVRKNLYNSAIKWLPDYLVNRSVKFDVRKYIQSTSDNS